MIIFRCIFCSAEDIPAVLLRCPYCGVETFPVEYRESSEPRPRTQPVAQTINFCVEPLELNTEVKFEEQNKSTGKDCMFQDSTYGIGIDYECRGSEVADTINFCSSNISIGLQQLSQDFRHYSTVKKSLSQEIQNPFGHTFCLNAEDYANYNPSSINFIPDPEWVSTAEPKHQISFSGSPPCIEGKKGSNSEMVFEKQKATESSEIQKADGRIGLAGYPLFQPPTLIQNGDRKIGFTGSFNFESRTPMVQSCRESSISKHADSENQGTSSSPDCFSKIFGYPSNENALSKCLNSVNEVALQKSHISNQTKRMNGLENSRAVLVKTSYAPISKKSVTRVKFPKRIRSNPKLDVQVQNNFEVKPHNCVLCTKKFVFIDDLRRHHSQVHKIRGCV